MTYDTQFRHAQALDPSGLDTIATCLHAIQAASKDCRIAGVPFENDPAVALLARHLGSVASRTSRLASDVNTAYIPYMEYGS